EAEAHRLGMSRHLMRLRRTEGRRTIGVPSVEEALTTDYSEPERDYIRYQQSLALEGSPERVRAGLEEIAAAYGVAEVLVVPVTHGYAARLRSYELLARACGLARD